MISVTECIRRIESLLESDQEISREQVAELVWAYAANCRRLNERAQRCLDLLRQGRQAEARELAKKPPSLEQELELLDFPERERWLDLCEEVGLPIRQSLNPQAVREVVQEVLGRDARLEGLLRLFRRMSLGQAPLADRLRVLRRIQQADPDHDFWEADVRAYEAARLDELIQEAQKADEQGDLEAIERILGELRGNPWLTPAAPAIRAIEKIAQPHRERWAQARFQEICEALREAHSEMDEARCRALLAEWQEVCDTTGVFPDEALQEAVAPVKAWLEDRETAAREDRAYQEACARLEKAIDEDAPRRKIERLATEVLRFERGMPELLAAKFHTRMEELASRARRRFALTMIGAVGGLALVAVTVILAIRWQMHQSEVAQWEQRIAKALAKDDLAAAGKLLETVRQRHPQVHAAAEIVAQRLAYEKKVEAEQVRRRAFDAISKHIEQQGPDQPDESALARAEKLAKTLQEKQWVQQWRLKYQEAAERRRREREAAFAAKLEDLQARHKALLQAELEERPDIEDFIRPVLDLADDLLKEKGVSQSLLAQVQAFRRHALQIRAKFAATAELRKATQQALENLPNLVGEPEKLEAALAEFTQKFSEHRLAAAFAQANRMASCWQAVLEWRRLWESWGGRLLVERPSEIEDRLAKVEAYLEKFPDGPFSEPVREYQRYLQTAEGAFQDGTLAGLDTVQNILANPIFSDALRIIRTKSGECYYAFQKGLVPQRAGGRTVAYTVSYLTSMTMSVGTRPIHTEQIKEGPIPAPQVAYRQWAEQRLLTFTGNGWETFYLELAAKAASSDAMDPVLAGQLLRTLLNYAASTTPFETDTIRRIRDYIDALDLDLVNWLTPESPPSAEDARRRMTAILQRKEIPSVVEAVKAQLMTMVQALRPRRPVGILLSRPNESRLRLVETLPDGVLEVVWARTGETPTFRVIGRVEGGKVAVTEELAAPFPDGSPVFFLEGEPPKRRGSNGS